MWKGAIAAPSGRQSAGVHRYRRRYDVRRCCFPRRHAEDGHPSAWFCVHRLMAAVRLPGARASPCLAALTSDRPLRGHHATICRILPLLNSDLIQLNRLSILSHPRERPNKIFRTPQSVHVCTPPTLTICQGVRPRDTFFPLSHLPQLLAGDGGARLGGDAGGVQTVLCKQLVGLAARAEHVAHADALEWHGVVLPDDVGNRRSKTAHG